MRDHERHLPARPEWCRATKLRSLSLPHIENRPAAPVAGLGPDDVRVGSLGREAEVQDRGCPYPGGAKWRMR